MSIYHRLLLIMKKNEQLKKSLILKLIEEKFNIKLNESTKIKIKNSTIYLDLLIFRKLFMIFILVIQINSNLN